jgi:hypothetical protein
VVEAATGGGGGGAADVEEETKEGKGVGGEGCKEDKVGPTVRMGRTSAR